MSTTRTQVAIVGAGPAGLLLSHLLDRAGIDSVLLENRSPDYVLGRIRAGVLESSSVDLLSEVGLGERIAREGDEHRGIYLQWTAEGQGERHHLDFVDHVGRSVWVYGQTEVTKDLMAARERAGQQSHYEVRDVELHDVAGDRPAVTFTDRDGTHQRLEADAVAGCDGFHGPSRAGIPADVRRTWERVYPYAWLGVLAEVAPSTDELIYAWHPDGFALHSMRSPTVSRLYLQVPPDEDVAQWPDDRVWEALATRLGHGQDGWTLQDGPIVEKSVLPMRSFVSTPMRHGRLFLAGDAAHIVPPTGAKGLNSALADVKVLGRALMEHYRQAQPRWLERYSATCLKRMWLVQRFSAGLCTMVHQFPGENPFVRRLQRADLDYMTTTVPGRLQFSENFTGLPIDA